MAPDRKKEMADEIRERERFDASFHKRRDDDLTRAGLYSLLLSRVPDSSQLHLNLAANSGTLGTALHREKGIHVVDVHENPVVARRVADEMERTGALVHRSIQSSFQYPDHKKIRRVCAPDVTLRRADVTVPPPAYWAIHDRIADAHVLKAVLKNALADSASIAFAENGVAPTSEAPFNCVMKKKNLPDDEVRRRKKETMRLYDRAAFAAARRFVKPGGTLVYGVLHKKASLPLPVHTWAVDLGDQAPYWERPDPAEGYVVEEPLGFADHDAMILSFRRTGA